MIDTRKVQGRRTLSFATLADAVREGERLASLERAGNLRALGNWTLGTALNHVAEWAEYPFRGYPSSVAHPPWFVKVVAKALKNRFARKPMPAGMRIPRIPEGTAGVEAAATTVDGLAHLRRAFDHLEREAPSRPNPVLGPLTHEDWKSMNLRHAELHLGFFVEG